MKAVVAAFNQEKALVGAFSVITNLRIIFGGNFFKHYCLHCLFSRAILCYLVNKYGQEEPRKSQLYPADPETRALVDRLLFFDNGTLYKNIVDYFVSINLPSTK